jgi:hypothetical protein
LGATRVRFWSIAPGEDSDEESDEGSAACSPVEISRDSLATYCRPWRKRTALSCPRPRLRFFGESGRKFDSARRRSNSGQVRRSVLEVQFNLVRSSLQRQERFTLIRQFFLRLSSCSSRLMRQSGWCCRGDEGGIASGDVVVYGRR